MVKQGVNKGGRKMSLISQNVRDVLQCRSNTLKKKRCRKRTAHTGKCWIHLAKENNLRVKKSRVPNAGKGLYAWKKTFARLSNVVAYTGEKTTMNKMDRKYGRKTIAHIAYAMDLVTASMLINRPMGQLDFVTMRKNRGIKITLVLQEQQNTINNLNYAPLQL